MAATVDILIRAQDQASKVIKAVGAEIGSAASSAVNAARNFTAGFQDITAGIGMLGAAVGAVQQAYAATVGKSMEYAMQVKDLSRTLGVATEESSKLIQMTKLVGISQGELEQAVKGATERGVGLSISKLQALAAQYQGIQSPLARSRFLTDTFGESGARMGRLLEQGAAGVHQLGIEAEKTGVILGEADVQAAQRLHQQSEKLNLQWEAMWVKLGTQVTPGLSAFVDVVTRANTAIEEENLVWTRHIAGLSIVAEAYALVKASIKGTGDQAEESAQQIAAANAQINSFYTGQGRLRSYKHGEGPAYPRTPSNPEGYVMDAYGNKTYPGRASGGTVAGGVAVLVGEKGPEIFVPSGNGMIGNPVAAGNGGGINVSLTLQSLVPPSEDHLERVLKPAVEKIMRDARLMGRY